MGFLGNGWLGLSWMGLSNYKTCSINAGGTVAEAKSTSINASAHVAAKKTYSINAGGAVSSPRTYVIDVGGHVIGYREYSINASAKVAELKSTSIDVGATIAELRSMSINAEGSKVAEKRSYSIAASALVIGWQVHTINASAHVAEKKTYSINASARVANLNSTSLLAIGKVAERKSIASILTASALVAQKDNYYSINARGTVTLPYHYTINATGIVIFSPYYALNSQDVTLAMLEGLKSSGPDPKFEKLSYPGRQDSKLIDLGHGPLDYQFEAYFLSMNEAFNYVNGVQLSSGDGRFYVGDTLWFHKIKKVATERAKRRKNIYFAVKTQVFLEKPWLYCDIAQEWNATGISLPRTSDDFVNNGHYDAPLELLSITGHYNAGYPKGLIYTIMDGVNALETIPLADQLLSEENIELDEDGILTSEYVDDYYCATRFDQDAVASNATCADGKVTIGNDGCCYYDFLGPWPLKANMELLATLHIVQGSPYIEVSVDGGLTYTTAVYSNNMLDGVEKIYYMDPSNGYKNIRVRFSCGPLDILEVWDVAFTAVRRTRGTATPKIEEGTTRQIRITDGAGSTHSVSIYARYRDIRRAI